MSRKKNSKYSYYYGNPFPNVYILMIAILIVLQWFRVGTNSGEIAQGVLPEHSLVNNGGLFIITLFFLAACACNQFSPGYSACRLC